MNKIFIVIFLFYSNIFYAQDIPVEAQDSLFFHLDKNILVQNKYEKEYFYLLKESTSTFAFLVLDSKVSIDSRSIKCQNLGDFLKKKYDNKKIKSFELSLELKNFKIFLCQCNSNQKTLIEVYPVTIEI